MSTFAVFGMTECFARQKARASTSTLVGGVDLTEGEWLEAVEQQTKKLMESTRMVRLSQPYDAPQFCRDFMRLAGGRAAGICTSAATRRHWTPQGGRPGTRRPAKSG